MQMRWYEMPASFYVFHFANAWEDEEGTVHVFGCQSDTIDLNAMSFHKEMGSRMTHYTVNPKTGQTSLKRVSGGKLGGFMGREDKVCVWGMVGGGERLGRGVLGRLKG
jgi:carotenoid cleavage dioxygenase-like enzyme